MIGGAQCHGELSRGRRVPARGTVALNSCAGEAQCHGELSRERRGPARGTVALKCCAEGHSRREPAVINKPLCSGPARGPSAEWCPGKEGRLAHCRTHGTGLVINPDAPRDSRKRDTRSGRRRALQHWRQRAATAGAACCRRLPCHGRCAAAAHWVRFLSCLRSARGAQRHSTLTMSPAMIGDRAHT